MEKEKSKIWRWVLQSLFAAFLCMDGVESSAGTSPVTFSPTEIKVPASGGQVVLTVRLKGPKHGFLLGITCLNGDRCIRDIRVTGNVVMRTTDQPNTNPWAFDEEQWPTAIASAFFDGICNDETFYVSFYVDSNSGSGRRQGVVSLTGVESAGDWFEVSFYQDGGYVAPDPTQPSGSNVCHVYFDLAGGSGYFSTNGLHWDNKKGEPLDYIPSKEPWKDGYNFVGWYDAAGVKASSSYIITQDCTFYARWEEKTYYVSFFDGDYQFSVGGALVLSLGGTQKITTLPNTPVKDGYEFQEWVFDGKIVTADTYVGDLVEGSENELLSGDVIIVRARWREASSGGVEALSAALDASGLSFTTGGDAAWFGQSAVSHDGSSAARSGLRWGPYQSSWMETQVTGPAHISFWWKVDSHSYDYLEFSIDGVLQDKISGEDGYWGQKAYTLESGSHSLKWDYRTDGWGEFGENCGWVDQLVVNQACILSFDANGGSGSMAQQTIYSGEGTRRLFENKFTRSGYRFVGWDRRLCCGLENRILNDKELVAYEDFHWLAPDVTLYAVWESTGSGGQDDPSQYVVNFNANGGSCSMSSKQYSAGATLGTLPTAMRNGYVFDGWYTSSSGGMKVTSSTMVTGDVTYYAHWSVSGGGVSLATALNASGFSFSNGGDAAWFGQAEVSHDGSSAARSGQIGAYQSSSMQTTVTGPADISFWWKVSSESVSYDYLEFLIDNEQKDKIGGTGGSWAQKSYSIGSGSHTLKWNYCKDGSYDSGDDCGWVDQLVVTPKSAPVDPPVQNGLVAWYKFDGNANDSSGNDHHLTNVGGAKLVAGRNGDANGAYEFNGTSTSRLSANPAVIVRGDFSYSLWFQTSEAMSAHGNSGTAWNPGNDIIHSGFADYEYVGSGLRVGTDGLAVVEHGGLYRSTVFQYKNNIGANWHHVVVVVAAGRGEVVYLDGEHVGEAEINSSTLTSLHGNGIRAIRLDGDGVGGGQWGYYTGCIDDLRIYNRALSAAEVKTLYGGEEAPAAMQRTVTFDANGGSCSTSSKQYSNGSTLGTLPTATRRGYAFDGWYTSSSGGSKVTSITTVTGNVMYYAHWVQNVTYYTVTFNANGGSCSTSSKQYSSGSTLGTLPTATRSGYELDGWYTAKSGGTKVSSSTTVTKAVTYYAHWTANTYALTFNANGGSVTPSSKSITHDATYGTLPTPSRTGASFLGWFTAASGGTQVSSATKVTGGATVYAHWKMDVYKIAFDANGGRCAEASRSREYGTTYGALPTPTQTGYLFLGWYTAPSGGTSVSATTVATGNATVYAHWSKEKMYVGCTWLSEGVFTAGVAAGAGDGILLDDYVTTESGIKSIAVTKLPAGMTYNATKRIITGFPTKAGTYNVEITVTAKSGAVEKQAIPLTVEALPAWAVGNFAGWVDCGDGTHGTASLSVTAAGAVSGKFLEHGSNWTFTAKSYDAKSVTRGERQAYLINAEASCGKAKRTVELQVRGLGLATGDLGGGETVEMWRNVWTEAEPKAYLATIAGKYTYFLTDGKSEPVALPLSLNSSSALLSGSVKIPWQANRSVTFSTTAFASSNGVEAVFYVAPDTKKGYPEFFERVTLIPESGEREAGKAHRNPGVLASAVAHEKGGNGSVSVSPAGGQVDAGKTVTLTASAKADSVFVRWEGTQGSRQFVDPNAKLVLTMDGEHDVVAEAVFRLRTSFDTPEVVVDSAAEYALKRISVGVPVTIRPVVRDEENMLPVKWSAQNLPTGLKIDATTGEITGVATAINSKPIVIIATSVADSKKVGKAELAADVKPEALPAWAVGDFVGTVRCADGTHGTASFTVSAAGKVTNGKLLEHGSNWTFTAASYAASSVTRGAEREFVIVADAACNKVKRTVELHVAGCPSAGVAASASGTSLAVGHFGENEVELWRNVWKDADAKGIVAGIAGKYTYFLSDGEDAVATQSGEEVALPLNLTSAGVLSGKVNVPARGNASVSFSTTVFASSNGVEAAFYVAPDAKKGYGEIYERFTLVPESGEREPGKAHRAPGVVAVPESYVSPEGKADTGMGTATVSPAGGQVDAGKTVTVSATADAKSVFVKWRYAIDGETNFCETAKMTFTMDGEHDVKAWAIFRSKESFAAPVVAVETSEQAKLKALELGVQFSAFVTVEDVENMKPVKWSASNLPSGLKINAETGEISGVATAVNTKPVVITATSVADSKKKTTFTLDIGAQDGKPAALPETAVGTFTGFVNNGKDALTGDHVGTFTFTSSEKGALSAKIVDAAGAVSFSGSGFAWSKDGKYGVELTTKKGEKLTLTLDSAAGWDKDQLTGGYSSASGRTLGVSAQRNAFSKAWYFVATGDETNGWAFAFTTDAKAAALTVTLKADGTTSIAGKIPNGVDKNGKAVTLSVSASGVANAGMMREGAMSADFAPVLTVNKVKKVLAIRTYLWFDRSNEHVGKEGEGVGEARFVE